MIEDLENYNEALEMEFSSLKQICFNRSPCDTCFELAQFEIISNPIVEINNTEAY